MINIIIPVFNGEKFLEECLMSLKRQTSQNFMAYVIDDGSNDSSYEIMKKYASENIIIFSQENKGVSYSRNKIIDSLQDGFMIFLDCDDYIREDTIKILNEEIDSETDLILFEYTSEKLDTKKGKKAVEKMDKEEVIKQMLSFKMRGHVCGKIFNVKKWKNMGAFENKKYCEDWFPIFKYISNCNRIKYMQEELYYYRQHNESTIHISNNIVIHAYDEAVKKIYDYSKDFLNITNKELLNFKLKASAEEIHEIRANFKNKSIIKDRDLFALKFTVKELLEIFSARNIKYIILFLLWKTRIYKVIG